MIAHGLSVENKKRAEAMQRELLIHLFYLGGCLFMADFDGSTLTAKLSDVLSQLSNVVNGLSEVGAQQLVGSGDTAALIKKTGTEEFTYTLDGTQSKYAMLRAQDLPEAARNDLWVIDGSKNAQNKQIAVEGLQVSVASGLGNDSVDASGARKGSIIDAGEGNNVVTLEHTYPAGQAPTDAYASEDAIFTDATTGVTYATDVTVISGAGNDQVTGIMNSTVNAGDGQNTLVSANTHTAQEIGNLLITGKGKDSIVAGDKDTIYAGDGIDTIDLVTNPNAMILGDTATIMDYNFDEGDIVRVTNTSDLLDVTKTSQVALNFTRNGHVIDYDGQNQLGALAIGGENDENYKVVVANGVETDNIFHVYFGGSAGSTLRATGDAYTAYMIGNNNDDARDYIIGGERNDTILAGEDDTVDGGAADDRIYIDDAASSVHVVFGTASGKDTVIGFNGNNRPGSGEDSDVVRVDEGISNLSAAVSGNNIVLTIGDNASLTLANTANKTYWSGVNDMYNVQLADTDGSTVSAAVLKANSSGTLTDAVEGVGYYYGSNSTLNAAAVTSKTVIDLGNTGNYGTNSKYSGIVAVRGSNAAENVLVGADGVNNTLLAGTGGANTLYGGGAGDNVMIGAAKQTDTFAIGAASGNDTVNNFVVTEDRVYAADGIGAVGATRDDNQIVLTFDNNSTMTLKNTAKNKVDVNTAIVYTADGTNNKEMLLGKTGSANTFNYDAAIDYFYGSAVQTDTLKVTGAADNKIYFDSRTGQDFTYVDVLDASASTGNNELGGGSSADSIIGGQGTDSLWGGIYGNDTLEGGTGRNVFYYGANEGNDVITKYNDGDKVMLYNVAEDQVAAGQMSGSDMVITLKDNSTLTVKGYGEGGSMSFELADATYTYDKSSGAWNKA